MMIAHTPVKGLPLRVVVGISGASGAAIGVRMVELLAQEPGVDVHLAVTEGGEKTLAHEVGIGAMAHILRMATLHRINDVGASIASGSFRTAGMIVAPCSMNTLSAIATSQARNLLLRAADVHLKERRRLVLVTRETPLHLGHIRMMAAATELGAIIAPPVPAFYQRPKTADEIVDQIARRGIDLLEIGARNLSPEWEGSTHPLQ